MSLVAHCFENRTADKQADRRTDEPRNQGNDERGVHGMRRGRAVAAADVPCNDDARSDRKAGKHIQNKIDHGIRRSDRTDRAVYAGKADNNHICGRIAGLHQIGQHERQSECKNFAEQRPFKHIHFPGLHPYLSHHNRSFLQRNDRFYCIPQELSTSWIACENGR